MLLGVELLVAWSVIIAKEIVHVESPFCFKFYVYRTFKFHIIIF